MSDRILRKAILKTEEDYADDGQVEAAQSEAVEEATTVAPLRPTRNCGLSGLREWAHRAPVQGRLESQR